MRQLRQNDHRINYIIFYGRDKHRPTISGMIFIEIDGIRHDTHVGSNNYLFILLLILIF